MVFLPLPGGEVKRLRVAAQDDVRAAARHVGGDGDGAGAACLCDDFGLVLMLLGVEHVEAQVALPEHVGELLRLLD